MRHLDKPVTTPRLVLLTSVTMLAFAANSLLCREALASESIDAASFTLLRLASGALVLWLLTWARHKTLRVAGSWLSAAALFGYAVLFSFAYNLLSAGTGALLLFGAVQSSMILYGLWTGERINARQWLGTLLAVGGLVWLVLPGVSAPSLTGAIWMVGAGICWGIYSLTGRGVGDPIAATAGNFVRAIPFALLTFVLFADAEQTSAEGVFYAVASGAVASGLGYALWYSVLPALAATTAAMVQLSVPVIAAFGGLVWLGEPVTQRTLVAAAAVLGGIGLFILSKAKR